MIQFTHTDRGHRVFTTDARGGFSTGHFGGFNLSVTVGEAREVVERNFSLLDDTVGARLLLARQVHGNQVHVVQCDGVVCATRPRFLGEGDAIVTDCVHRAIAVYVADCVPIVIETDSAWVAVVHAGRRGIELGVIEHAADLLRKMSGQVALFASVGPSICVTCYEVSPQVATQFQDDTDEVGVVVRPPGSTRPHLDLRMTVRAQLAYCGIEHALFDERCTYESDTLYSHRRATHDGVVTGRYVMGVVSRDR